MRHRLTVLLAGLCAATCISSLAFSRDDSGIWREFTQMLRNGKMTLERIRPYDQLGDSYKPILLAYLDSLRSQASPDDWETQPEIIRVDHRIQFIVPWSSAEGKVTYCLSFLLEDSTWYFQHLETIFIRLDKVTNLPASRFPDIPESQKNWVREEAFWSFVVMNFYLPTAREKGKEAALSMLKDGGGYSVAARAWVPFSAPHKAFILYLSWEQANLRGNDVTLVKLEDNEAVVRLKTHFFAVYFAAAHLKPILSIDDYKQIFETVWRDRAASAGWRLDIQYSPDYEVTFHFTRGS